MNSERGSRTPAIVAGLLMVGFIVWMVLQMAPHGPKNGALMVRLSVGLGLTIVGSAIVFVLLRAVERRHRR